MIPVPFSINSYQNRSIPASAQRCFNLYPESIPEGKSQVVLHGTPGLKVFADAPHVGQVRGMCLMGGELYTVILDKLYKVSSAGSYTEIGAVSGSGRVYMATNGTDLAITTGGIGYVYDGAAFAQITDTDFPTAATCSFINQRIVFDSEFGFTYTELDDATSMAGSVNGTGSPDQAISVLTDHLEVWLFGETSIEVWYNSTSVSTPFERLQGAFIERGCAAKYSPAKMDNSVYWLGDDFAVYRAQAYAPIRISTPTVEREIQSYHTDDAFGFSYVEEGHSFYVLTFPTSRKTWVYDAATQRWHERGNFSAGRIRANCYIYAYDRHLVGDFENGIIYEMDLDTFTDNGETIQRIAVSPPIHSGGEDIFMSKLWIDMESGQGLTTGQGSDPQAMLQASDDAGVTWNNERWVTIGKKGKYRNRAIWRRMGTFFNRVYRLTISDPIKVVIIGAWGDYG